MTEDGGIVMWNTYSGCINYFEPRTRTLLEDALSKNGFTGALNGFTSYLLHRGYLVSADTDELRRVNLRFGQQQYRTDVLELILLASEDCNFRCTYCYEDFARGTMTPEVRSNVRKLLARQAPGLQRLSISWFGGEPLYGFPAIEEIAPFAQELAKSHGISYGSHMTTNGYLLTPEIADSLLSWGINHFQITLDGPPEFHDCSRPARDGSATFGRILENLICLKSRSDDYTVRLRINIDKDNCPSIEGFLDTLKDVFAHDSRFQVALRAVGKWGGPNDASLNVCTDTDTEGFNALRDAAKNGGFRTETLKDHSHFGSLVCYAARPYNVIVGANGQLMKCTVSLEHNEANLVGQLNCEGELEFDQDKLAMWVNPSYSSDPLCGKCHLMAACQGNFCPLIRIEENRQPCPPLKNNLHAELLTAL
jgi:uncharacterized protein